MDVLLLERIIDNVGSVLECEAEYEEKRMVLRRGLVEGIIACGRPEVKSMVGGMSYDE